MRKGLIVVSILTLLILGTSFLIAPAPAQGIFDEECPYCHGTGKITVEETCGICYGTGEIAKTCDNCGGIGEVTCTKCKGSGTIIIAVQCVSAGCKAVLCDCPDCHGTGKLTCLVCKGVGEITTSCVECGGDGKIESKVTCPRCGGRGYVTDWAKVDTVSIIGLGAIGVLGFAITRRKKPQIVRGEIILSERGDYLKSILGIVAILSS